METAAKKSWSIFDSSRKIELGFLTPKTQHYLYHLGSADTRYPHTPGWTEPHIRAITQSKPIKHLQEMLECCCRSAS